MNIPKITKAKEISLYGNPANGKAITEKEIPNTAKNEITQGVQP